MHGTTTGLVTVPGAHLFFKRRGSGPPVLVLQGGPHDADGADALAARLGDGFTVIGMDRRGQSRSPKIEPSAPVTVAVHAADALAILDAVSPEPAVVVGSSIGAVIGLEMVSQRPDRIRLLIAHEPPVAQLLADHERAKLVGFPEALEMTHRREGAGPAMRMFIAALGVDPQDREDDVEPPAPSERMAQNLESFLTHDAPAVRTYQINLVALRRAALKIHTVVGKRSRGTLHGAGSVALTQALGIDLVELPGGHGGYATHPTAFAKKLRELLGR
jgi:pimeloyl-ACP methyl ester carboxylesterase